MKQKKIISSVMALAMAAGVISGCSASEDAAQDDPVVIGVFDMPSLYLMQTFDDMGAFEENGANVEFEFFPVYSDAISAFNTNNVDMIIYACAEAVTPVVNGIDCKIIGVVDTSDGLDGIAAVSGIDSIEDLAGKNVATEIGTVDHMMLQRALAAHGMSESDINLINMSSGDAVAAMNGGSLDAVSTWEPQLSAGAELGSIIYSTKDDPELIADVFLIHTEALDAGYDNVKAILKTWYEGIEKYSADPDSYSTAAAEKGGLSTEEFESYMSVTRLVTLEENKTKFTYGSDDMVYLNVLLRNVGDFLKEGGLIEKELTDDMISGMIDSRIIDELNSQG